ncbi:MAG: S1C family serine protease [Candidatus Methylomirabilia bacterium]
MRGVHSRGILLVAVLGALLFGCAGPSPSQVRQESSGPKIPPEIGRLNDLLAELAERLKSGLVQIRARRAESTSDDGEAPPHPDGGRRASGSGFLIREDGLIATNAHVVAGAERIQVRLADGRRFEGKLVGKDSRVDLALVKVDGAEGLPALGFGDSNRLRVGEFVLALGHPFGLEQSVSFGIVSRKGAPLRIAAPGFDFIQTDAAVNPGNSGGPLVNMAGEVVGVNSMAVLNGSIGFAIPANLVEALVPDLLTRGKVEWGWLGVRIDEVSEEEVPGLGLSEAHGVLIRQVMPGEPADKGGLETGDVILAVDDEPVREPRDLQRIIATTPPGKTVKLRLVRQGKETEVSITVGLYREPEARRP